MDEWKYEPAHDMNLPPAERWRSLQRESGLFESTVRLLWRGAIRSYLTCYHRLRIEGREHLPGGPPFVMIANHTSHLDTLAMSAALPARLRNQVLPLAAGDTFFETPALAAFAAAFLNALPLWRRNCGRHALAQMRERLVEEPCAYILFPEGTRSRDGVMRPFKSGLGMIVASTPAPVVPVHISGAFEALGAGKCFPRPRRVRLRIGQSLRFDDIPNNREGWDWVASAAQSAVEALSPTRACV